MHHVEKDTLIYAQGRPEHAEAVAKELIDKYPGTRIYLAAGGNTADTPEWAVKRLSRKGLRRALKSGGVLRPDLFVLVLSNEPTYLKPVELLRAFLNSILLRPRERSIYLYAWSGRYSPGEKIADLLRKGLGILARPFYLTAIRLFYLILERAFPLINKKSRDAPYEPARVGSVLFISVDLIGDLVWAAPAISSAKKTLPGARVDLLVNSSNEGLAGLVEGVDRVIKYDAPWLSKVHSPEGTARRRISRWKNLLIRWSLLRAGYDLAVDFRGEARDIVLAYLTGAPYRAGFAGKSTGAVQSDDVSYLLTNRVDFKGLDGRHILQRNMRVVNTLGFQDDTGGRWFEPAGDAERRVRGLLEEAGVGDGDVLIGMQPGASRPVKRWSPDGFALVARELMKEGAKVVIAGSQGETGLARSIRDKAPGVIDLSGRTSLGEFVALVKACGLFICNDTSAISIASAVKTPVVCMMITVPEHLGPYGVKSVVLQKRPECWSPDGELCFCPYGYRCLQEITPDEVLSAARGLLDEVLRPGHGAPQPGSPSR